MKIESISTEIGNKRWAGKYPEMSTAPVAAGSCISPEYFERERERIFRRSWLCVGNECEIPERGDYMVREVAICDAQVLVIRGNDGRGARLSQRLLAPRQHARLGRKRQMPR